MSIVLEGITKRYDGQAVVNHVSLEIENGEFFVLLGSSGSGKTTILNLIAGLTSLDEGRIFLHGREVTDLPTQQRRVGFVFQQYALFQHMTVAENIDFGPTIHKVSKAERHERREKLLELVGLTGLGGRMPRQLSGGQQQRVALARALALQPDVLLLDEPLGALDAKIRQDLRYNLRTIQRRLGVAAILVTHDQEEAFDLADRIGVMSYGRLIEVDTPQRLYQYPKTEFVASFLGSANLLVGDYRDGGIQIGPRHFSLGGWEDGLGGSKRVQILFRPEDVALAASAEALDAPPLGQAEVEEVSYLGQFERLRLRLPSAPGIRPISPPVPYGYDNILLDATRSPDDAQRGALNPGDPVWVGIRRVHAITNPGLNALIVTDGSQRSQAALALGGHIGRMAYARVTLLGYGDSPDVRPEQLQEIRKQLGAGLAALEAHHSPAGLAEAVTEAIERQVYDLVVLSLDMAEHLHEMENILQGGEYQLLLAPCPQPAPAKTLICVASGEPGKEDIFFTGRLMHHLGASATLLNVIPPGAESVPLRRTNAQSFLENGLKSLSLLGVRADARVTIGPVAEEIVRELKEGGYDMLVMGAPLPDPSGHIALRGVIQEVLQAVNDRAVLIVRSQHAGWRPFIPPARRKVFH